MAYIDGFLIPVPGRNLPAYRRMARKAGKVWMEYGALQYLECVEDDVSPGQLTSFPLAVQRKRGEVVLFSFIVYRSRRHRDAVNRKVMADPRIEAMSPGRMKMPFDPARMVWGGFESIVAL
ncbi:DUF1428 domain-containing protein [Luteimonas saliphila]|uniref:DUF1428 domain-containing protein n=1 Tax=Luteimonas saliphila TaxID=2804919 RepID=UPI00192D7EE6|nr:DUF1428 domain-containing protein [Luteimonas saliphila]